VYTCEEAARGPKTFLNIFCKLLQQNEPSPAWQWSWFQYQLTLINTHVVIIPTYCIQYIYTCRGERGGSLFSSWKWRLFCVFVKHQKYQSIKYRTPEFGKVSVYQYRILVLKYRKIEYRKQKKVSGAQLWSLLYTSSSLAQLVPRRTYVPPILTNL
jgi:hypothetical protein